MPSVMASRPLANSALSLPRGGCSNEPLLHNGGNKTFSIVRLCSNFHMPIYANDHRLPWSIGCEDQLCTPLRMKQITKWKRTSMTEVMQPGARTPPPRPPICIHKHSYTAPHIWIFKGKAPLIYYGKLLFIYLFWICLCIYIYIKIFTYKQLQTYVYMYIYIYIYM